MTGKLIYIINHMDWFWSHRLPLASAAQVQGWDVRVAATNAAKDDKLTAHNFKKSELSDSSSIVGLLRTTCSIHKLLKQEQPDLVHAITLKYAFMTGLAARFHRSTKLVFTIAGLGYLFSDEGLKPKLMRMIVGPFLKLALKDARIIFQNPDDLQLMVARGFANSEQCTLIRSSGVDTNQFAFSPETSHKTPIVVMPTRLLMDKGVGVFIEAARILKNRGVNADFRVAGGVAGHSPLSISADDMSQMTEDGAARWLGKVDDMPGLLAGCNLVVYPSWYREGVPKVLLEAASAGRAIVTTDHPGCREAVNNNENGLLVPVKNPAATADAIEKLLTNETLRKKMGLAGRKRAETEFNVQKIVAETLKVYQS